MPATYAPEVSAFAPAERLRHVGFSDIVQIRNRVMALRAEGNQVWGLHGGEPFFDTPAHIKQAMISALERNETRYAPSSGLAPLREAIADKLHRFNRVAATPDNVLLTVGGAHALYSAFQSVLNAGDEVLLFSPYWTPIRDLITGAEGIPELIDTAAARRDGIARTLARHLTRRTRAIYYNTPQNPSGVVFSRAEAEEVAAFAQQHDLIVIADEAYEDLVYSGEHFSIARLPGMAERTITCYTLSKSYAMTGWRAGYVVAQEPWLTAMRKIVLYSTNGVSTPTQWAALAAVTTPRTFLEERLEDYRERRDLMAAGLRKLGFACATPEGAFYAFAGCTHISHDSRRAAEILLDRAHVAAIPGVVFGPQGEGHLRFGYATSLETIRGALTAMAAM